MIEYLNKKIHFHTNEMNRLYEKENITEALKHAEHVKNYEQMLANATSKTKPH